jgi:dTMP kinase
LSRGYFISFEGGEGCGKSTQVQKLADRLSKDHEVVMVHEPGGTALGESIRNILQSSEHAGMDPWAEALLFAASRAQIVNDVIAPAVERGAVVIADRFFDSTYAYQGSGRGLDMEALRMITKLVCGETKPDLTLLLDVPLELSQARRKSTELQLDRIELEGDEFHRRVYEGFHDLAAKEPERVVVIDGMRSIDVIADEIYQQVKARIGDQVALQ